MPELEVRQLNKSFGTVHAVKDVFFSIPEGAIFGLIGRNGAGKTTTIRMMMDIIGPDSGDILLDRKQAKIEDLSKGNQQKVQFIAAILSDPDFLILDEPFSGLDPVNTDILKEIIIDLKQQGKMIIFSTHLMDFADRMCEQIALIHQGQLVLNGALHDIKKQYSACNISLVYEGDISFLEQDPMVENISDYGNATGISLHHAEDIQKLLVRIIYTMVI